MSRILHKFGEALEASLDREVQWYLAHAKEAERQRHLARTRALRGERAEPERDK